MYTEGQPTTKKTSPSTTSTPTTSISTSTSNTERFSGTEVELHVQDTNSMWLEMRRDLSDRLLDSWRKGENLKVLYLGDWEGARACYVIDFATMCQRKFGTECEYPIKIFDVWAKGAATE